MEHVEYVEVISLQTKSNNCSVISEFINGIVIWDEFLISNIRCMNSPCLEHIFKEFEMRTINSISILLVISILKSVCEQLEI